MKHLALFLLVLLLPNLCAAQQQVPSFPDGNKLLQFCQSEDSADVMWCAGYISAAASASQSDWVLKNSSLKVCIPSGVTLKQLIDMAVKYLKDHPEKRHLDAFPLVVVSWSSFACSSGAK